MNNVQSTTPNAELEAARVSTEHHFRVNAGLRVVIQVREVNIYTYTEDLVAFDDHPRKYWQIRGSTIAAHGKDNFYAAKASAAHLFQELKVSP